MPGSREEEEGYPNVVTKPRVPSPTNDPSAQDTQSKIRMLTQPLFFRSKIQDPAYNSIKHPPHQTS
jgi:hypothetical protein